jgi:hypothetical protein
MKKTIYTLNINSYAPEIRAITRPYLESYASKIGAEIVDISERRFPEMPVVYEKLQIKELATERKDDWAIYFDSDALIHPETIDFTNFLSKDTVMHNGKDMANIRWKYDKYFLRDGRNIGSCNWFTVASDWCLDLWTPLDIPLEEALKNIRAIPLEKQTVITDEHLIDDYTLSRNIARFGLKFTKVSDILEKVDLPNANFFWHQYTHDTETKIKMLQEVIKQWNI